MKKKLALFCLLGLMICALFAEGILANASGGDGSSVGQNVTDLERVTSQNDLKLLDFYKEITLQKNGTGTGEDSKTFGGLVPYGSGSISLGTYDMTATSSLSAPLFTILPQKEWKTTTAATADADNMFFYVDLTSGSKIFTFRFAKATRTDANFDAVFMGTSTYTAGQSNNIWQSKTVYPYTVLPFRYDGTVTDADIANETGAKITVPQEIGFYYNAGHYYMDTVQKSIATNESVRKESATGSGKYRYDINVNISYAFTAAELSAVNVSVRFDKGTVTKEEAWVMFTSVAGKRVPNDYADADKYFADGDTYLIDSETSTITLNKKVSLADNDALTKLVEFETPSMSAGGDIKDVIVSFKGSANVLDLRFTPSPEKNAVLMLVSFASASNNYRWWRTQQRGNNNAIGTDGSLSGLYGKEYSYYFNGIVANGDNVDEQLNQLTTASVVKPRFAMYFDAASKTFYTDNGRVGVGQVQYGDINRWSVCDLAAAGDVNQALLSALIGEKLDVSIKVTMTDGVTSSYLKLTNIDGQSLDRESLTSENYTTVYHSYAVAAADEKRIAVGQTFNAPSLIDNGILNQFAAVATENYTLKVNDVEITGTSFNVPQSGENTIEYYVEGNNVGSYTFNAENVNVSLYNRGASIRYKASDTENGVRFAVAIKKSDVVSLEGFTVNAGILVVGKNQLAVDETLSVATLEDETKKAKNVVFDFATECTEVVVGEIEYYQMVVYIYNIPATDYGTEIMTRGYLSVNGVYIYSDAESRSISYVAQQCVNDPKVSETVKEAVRKYIVS